MKRLLLSLGLIRPPKPDSQDQVFLDLEEAQLALLDSAKKREYYEAVERMLRGRVLRLQAIAKGHANE